MMGTEEPAVIKASLEELPEILWIYEAARQFMRENGNPAQWGKTYPSQALVEEDIAAGRLYLLMKEDSIQAVFSYAEGEDPCYQTITEGRWLNDRAYGTVHRIAVTEGQKGAASWCLNWAYSQCGNLKIDTHRDNLPMQKLLLKNGFLYCGKILTDDGTERLAYQKAEPETI